MQHVTSRPYFTWILGFAFILAVAFFAYHYARLTSFPIGDDPAVHIESVQTASYGTLLHSRYPLPLLVFKALYGIGHIEVGQLFVYLICTFLFIATLSFTWLARTITGSWYAAMLAGIFFISARWVNDALRMGLLAEVFGWTILFLTLHAFIRRRLWLTLLMSVVLAFSHPFGAVVFGLVVLLYYLLGLFHEEKEEKHFLWWLFAGYGVMGLAAYLIRPELVRSFVDFISTDPAGWGNRTLWQILAGDDTRRLLIPLLAMVGMGVASARIAESGIRMSYLLVFIGLFFSLNYLFGINFIPFRFYVYLEMGLALFAGVALYELLSGMRLTRELAVAMGVGLAILLVLPNYRVNQTIGFWQATNPDAHAVMLPEDRNAFAWIKDNIAPSESIMAPRKQGLWIKALIGHTNTIISELAIDPNLTKDNFSPEVGLGARYLYYSVVHQVPNVVKKYYEPIYRSGSVSIWELKHAR